MVHIELKNTTNGCKFCGPIGFQKNDPIRICAWNTKTQTPRRTPISCRCHPQVTPLDFDRCEHPKRMEFTKKSSEFTHHVFLNQPKFGRMRSEPSKRMDDLQAGYLVNWLLAHVAKNHGQGNDWEWELPHYGHPPNRLNQVRILGSERNLVGGF